MTDTTVKKYRARPIVVEAIQWTGKNWDEVKAFAADCVELENGTDLIVKMRYWCAPASKGDYIVKDEKGEFSPCEPAPFEARYELQEIEPCPACGEHDNIRVTEFSDEFGGRKHSYCASCSEQGPTVEAGEDIVAAWDKWAIETRNLKHD